MKLRNNWKLYYVQDCLWDKDIKSIKQYSYFDGVKIPTLFELEIYHHGLLGHPYESTNNWDYQKYEDHHQFYVYRFSSKTKNKYLKLNGVDTIAHIYINGKLIGKTSNMFIPYTFKLENLKRNNELVIHVLPSVLEGRKFKLSPKVQPSAYSDGVYLRKTPSSFGWDILPRTPLGGLYKDVELLDSLPVIEDVYVKATDITQGKANLKIKVTASNDKPYRFEIEGKCGNSSFKAENNRVFALKNPKLWNVRGYGKPHLYRITVKAFLDDKLVETKTIKYGIRKIELKRTSTVCEGGCFEFYINDQKVFLMGSNWVPIEAIKHIDDERMLKTLDMLVDLNCNAVRVWGGGTYESDLFYEKCDELGIFVWQDFMMACAIYPQDSYFQKKIKEEAEYVVKHLRNHACICLWAGDNEDDLACWWSKGKLYPHENILTRETIPNVIKKLDGTRPYLPSSPYVDEYAENHPKEPLSEDHLWGPRDYFKGEFYNNATCYFTSETGYHALNNLSSLEKFIKKPWPIFINEKLQKLPNSRLLSEENLPTKEYLCHGTSIVDDYNAPYAYRTLLMANQVNTLFINEIDNINDFIMASQISQAEAMKFFIERMRKDYSRNGGIIWWNIIDGWPQVSDAVVDYYFSKKLAYGYIKRSQKDVLLMLNEDKDGLNLYCVNNKNTSEEISYEIIDANNGQVIDDGVVKTKPRDSFIVKTKKADNKTLLIIKYKDKKGNDYINHFHTHIIDIDLYNYINLMNKYNLLG